MDVMLKDEEESIMDNEGWNEGLKGFWEDEDDQGDEDRQEGYEDTWKWQRLT